MIKRVRDIHRGTSTTSREAKKTRQFERAGGRSLSRDLTQRTATGGAFPHFREKLIFNVRSYAEGRKKEKRVSSVSGAAALRGPKALDIKEGLAAARAREEPFERHRAARAASAKVKVHLCGPEKERQRRPHERFMPARKTARGVARHLR